MSVTDLGDTLFLVQEPSDPMVVGVLIIFFIVLIGAIMGFFSLLGNIVGKYRAKKGAKHGCELS